MALGRMSSLERMLGCAAFGTVDSSEDVKSENAVIAATYGTALHTAKEGGPVSHLLSREDVNALPYFRERYAGWEHEVHLSYDVARSISYRYCNDEEKRRETQDLGTHLTGCTDGVMFDQEGQRIFVNDLKSSQHPVELTDPQLLGYLLWALTHGIQTLGFDPKRVSLNLSVLHWPRQGAYRDEYMDANGRPCDWYSRDVPLDEMREFRQKLKIMAQLAAIKHLEPGPHCVYCPGVLRCPAQHPTFRIPDENLRLLNVLRKGT